MRHRMQRVQAVACGQAGRSQQEEGKLGSWRSTMECPPRNQRFTCSASGNTSAAVSRTAYESYAYAM